MATPHASTESTGSCSEVVVIFFVGQRLLSSLVHLVAVLGQEGLIDVGLWGCKSGSSNEFLLRVC